MPKPFRVIQIGFGTLGRSIAKAIIQRENLQLEAVIDVNPDLKGKQLSELFEGEIESNLVIRDDLQQVISDFQENPADVAIVSTSSSLTKVVPTISDCLNAGMDVLSLCEELSFPYEKNPELSKKLNEMGQKTKKSILGTGINPGYLMDLLPIFLSAPIQHVET